MEMDDASEHVVPFQLQFDKPLASQVKIAEWNPEKDLLAMVTDDSKILLHRFNWQRLWTVSPGKSITSLCWRPDGKAIAVGLEDGTISLHDVESGKSLRSLKSHTAPVVCLNWEEESELSDSGNSLVYEDRTPRFFPPAPRAPRVAGVVTSDASFMDDNEDSYRQLSNSSYQRFNILCSGDKDGSICFSIFGIFPIGKVNIHKFPIPTPQIDKVVTRQLANASICKVALSKDLCQLIVLFSGDLVESTAAASESDKIAGRGMHGLVLDTSIFGKRKNELHQLAQQASNIEDLTEVIRSSLSVMVKQWADAVHTFSQKFGSLSTLITDHGLDSSPQEEFLSLLGGARTSPAVHQFLVNSLGEAGVKRVSKTVSGGGKELQRVVLDHLQPAAEIIAFRMGELRGLSRWRSRFQGIGLDEKLIAEATEKFRSSYYHGVIIRASQAEGPIRRPVAPPLRQPLKPAVPPSSSPPPPPPTPPAVAQLDISGDKGFVTLEFQRQKAKELQQYFKQKKLEEANLGPLFGFLPKNEISNGRWAMFGFSVGLLTEYATGSDFVVQVKILFSNFGILDLD